MAKERVFKDKGLAKAIKAAGGVRALARRPWDGSRPYERVLDVERVRSAASRPRYRSSGSGGVAMDSLPAHEVPAVKELIEGFGVTVQ
jgi:hypothetical protein